MVVRKWLTKNATTVVEKAVEQGKQTIAANVGNKTNLYYKFGRLGLLVLLAWLTGKEMSGYLNDGGQQKSLPSPNNVVVNNYIYEPNSSEQKREERSTVK